MGGWPRTTDGRLEQVNGCSRWRLMLGSYTNGTVTFRIRAPLAQAVALHGEWMAQGAGEAMRRQADGAWSLTVSPPPGSLLVCFRDRRLAGSGSIESVCQEWISGTEQSTGSPRRRVPQHPRRSGRYGSHHTYASRATSSPGRLHVYTPPGCDPARGSTLSRSVSSPRIVRNDGDWVHDGRAGIILDNLLAERKAAPMLIVMPDGHRFPSFDTATRARDLGDLRRDLLEEILPLIERSYRVTRNAKGRAIAGFSMGETQALHLGLSSIEQSAASERSALRKTFPTVALSKK